MIKATFLITLIILSSSDSVGIPQLPQLSRSQRVIPSKTHPQKSSPIMLGGYTMLANPSDVNFETALRRAIQKNGQLNKANLIMAEVQALSGFTNYRLSFMTSNGITQTTIPISSNNPAISLYSIITADEQTIRNFIQAKYPLVKGYNLSEIRQSPSTLRLYVSFQKNSVNEIKYSQFQIAVMGEIWSCNKLYGIDVSGYTMEQLFGLINKIFQKFPKLKGSMLSDIKNIPQQGLLFTFYIDYASVKQQQISKVQIFPKKSPLAIEETSPFSP